MVIFPIKIVHGQQVPDILWGALTLSGFIEPVYKNGYITAYTISKEVYKMTTNDLEEICQQYLYRRDNPNDIFSHAPKE